MYVHNLLVGVFLVTEPNAEVFCRYYSVCAVLVLSQNNFHWTLQRTRKTKKKPNNMKTTLNKKTNVSRKISKLGGNMYADTIALSIMSDEFFMLSISTIVVLKTRTTINKSRWCEINQWTSAYITWTIKNN